MADLTKPMYGYWGKQPAVLRDLLARKDSLVSGFAALYRQVRPDHIYLVGSGTSLNACTAAAPYFSRFLGVPASVVIASLARAPLHGERPLVVFLSQGGSSTNTLEAMERLAGYPYVTVTGEENSEIERRSERHMLLGIGEELAGPKTVGYTASVLFLTLCAIEAARATGAPGCGEAVALLEKAAEQMQANLARCEAWFAEHQQALLECPKYVLVGNGTAAVAAAEGALKMQETVKVPCMAFEFEEYLHGPLLMTDEGLGGIFFLSHSADVRPKMQALARCHAMYSKYTFVVGFEEGEVPGGGLYLESTGDDLTACYETVLLPQLIAGRVPVILGIPDGAPICDEYAKLWQTKYNDGR